MTGTSDLAILRRILDPLNSTLSPEGAQCLLALDFAPADRARMHELVVKNQSGALPAGEQAELESYLRVGRVPDLLHSKARQALKTPGRDGGNTPPASGER
jgi:hypothetical protein